MPLSEGMMAPLAAVAGVIYDELHTLGFKSQGWDALSDKQKAGWIPVARRAVGAYEREVDKLSDERDLTDA